MAVSRADVYLVIPYQSSSPHVRWDTEVIQRSGPWQCQPVHLTLPM